MSIPNSATSLPSATKYAFIQDQPDWGQDVSLTLAFDTGIFSARNSAEQRSCNRLQPIYSQQYTIAAMNTAEYSVRRSAALLELSKPMVCPMWTEFSALASMTNANTAHFASAIDKRGFKVGSFAYFVQGANVCFRKIIALASADLTFDPADFVPAGTLPTFTAGARVYSCIIGRHPNDTISFSHLHLNRNDEMFAIEEL